MMRWTICLLSLAGLTLAVSSRAIAGEDYPPTDCETRAEVLTIEPYAGLLPSRSTGKPPLYRVQYRQCGLLHQVLIEPAAAEAPNELPWFQPNVF